jgi:hypothetical protein
MSSCCHGMLKSYSRKKPRVRLFEHLRNDVFYKEIARTEVRRLMKQRINSDTIGKTKHDHI